MIIFLQNWHGDISSGNTKSGKVSSVDHEVGRVEFDVDMWTESAATTKLQVEFDMCVLAFCS
jgi:hypothetical protein